MSTITIFGLGLDIIGASILVIADMPSWRKDFSSFCPVLRDGEVARKRLTTDVGGDEVILKEASPGYKEIASILGQRRKQFSGPIRSHKLADGPFSIKPKNSAFLRPVYSEDLSNWVAEWEAKYIRRLGLSVLIFGFVLQIVAVGFLR